MFPSRMRPFIKVFLILALLVSQAAGALVPDPQDGHGPRHFDARAGDGAGLEAVAPMVTEEALTAAFPGAVATFDGATGVTRTLSNPTGYLTGPHQGQDALAIAEGFVAQSFGLLGLGAADVSSTEVRDVVFSRATGATHVYLRQLHQGVPVYNGQLHVNVNRDGRLISVNNAFSPDLPASAGEVRVSVDAAAAVAAAARHLGLALAAPPAVLGQDDDPRRTTRLDPEGLSAEPIEARLAWLPIRRGDVRLVWSFQIHTLDGRHAWDLTVGADDATVWTGVDWVASEGSYKVYPEPTESPNHTTPLPPADGRTLVQDPEDPVASPLGWHDDGTVQRTILRGNNVHAYHDRDGNNQPPAPADEPDCDDGAGNVVCDFPIDLADQPPASVDAAVTNLFYWNNVLHDVQYQYGFDEAGGNFQVSNGGQGGLGGDDVRAEAQDNDIGGSNCNANFFTPPDGNRPRMQMFTCNIASPERDGDFDNGVIVHEYGHGISNRQVGGPSSSSCLGNIQQAGEGLSDWWALVYTADADDTRTDARGIGTYLLGQNASGPGIRRFPYSTDTAVNPDTYETIGDGVSVPHGVGSVWTAIAWEVYWDLVDTHGFDPDLRNAQGGAGNQRAMLYVNEGLKNAACGPTFLDLRDGIVQAAVDNYGGEDVCLLWEAFARRGLGVDAQTTGPASLNAKNGFDVPLECGCQPPAVATVGDDQVICPDQFATLGGPPSPFNSYQWSNGATTSEITVSPLVTTTYTLTASTELCGEKTNSATIYVQDGPAGIADDFEGGAPGWTATGLWHLADPSVCADASPDSPATAFYFGQDATCDYDLFPFASSGDLVSPLLLGLDADSVLEFNYWREVEFFPFLGFDVTQVDVLVGDFDEVTVFQRSSLQPSLASWQHVSIPLGQFAGQPIRLRFRFDSLDPVFNFFTGWYVDDVVVTGTSCPVDLCPGTVLPETVPTFELGVNRFALVDADGVFDTTPPEGQGPAASFTLEDTRGCSCAQIIERLGLGEGHVQFGCSLSAMREWVEQAASEP